MKPDKQLKHKIQFLKLLNQARQKMNWTVAKLDDNLYVVGKKEQVGYLLSTLQEETEEVTSLPEIPDKGSRTEGVG